MATHMIGTCAAGIVIPVGTHSMRPRMIVASPDVHTKPIWVRVKKRNSTIQCGVSSQQSYFSPLKSGMPSIYIIPRENCGWLMFFGFFQHWIENVGLASGFLSILVSWSGPIGSWSPAPKLDSRPFSSFSMSDFSDFPSSERLLLWAVDAAV